VIVRTAFNGFIHFFVNPIKKPTFYHFLYIYWSHANQDYNLD